MGWSACIASATSATCRWCWTVGLSVADIYAAWWDKASVIGGILAILCAGTVALCVMFRLEMARRIAAETALVGRAETLAVMAATDGLTGLANRRAFEGEMFRAWRHAIRSEEPLSLLMIDADHFKLYNDGYGHPAGDRVLRAIAHLHPAQPAPSPRPGRTLWRRGIRGAAARHRPGRRAPRSPSASASPSPTWPSPMAEAASAPSASASGSVAARPTLNDREAGLLKQADQALYQAKRDGRNRRRGRPLDGRGAAGLGREPGGQRCLTPSIDARNTGTLTSSKQLDRL